MFECVETGAHRSAYIDGSPEVVISIDNEAGWTGDHVNLYMPAAGAYMGMLLGLY